MSESPWNIFSSFSGLIWSLIGLFFIAYGALNWLRDSKGAKERHKLLSSLSSLVTHYVDMFALLLGQGTGRGQCWGLSGSLNSFIGWIKACRLHTFINLSFLSFPGTVPLSSDVRSITRNPLILWLFAAFLLRQLFATDITALLLSRGQFRLDSFSQIQAAGKNLKILIENQSSSYYIFKEVRSNNFVFQFYLVKYYYRLKGQLLKG